MFRPESLIFYLTLTFFGCSNSAIVTGLLRKYINMLCTTVHSTYSNIELSTLSCRVSYVPRLAKVVNVFAIRQVKQGTETTGFSNQYRLYSAVCTRVNM